jgi:hypothetical protein
VSAPTYHVYVSEGGSILGREVAAVLAAALTELGYPTVFPAQGLPERRLDRVNLVVAPHEFYPAQRGIGERNLLRAARASTVVGVAEPGTASFELGAHYASVGTTVLDLSPRAVDHLRGMGMDATHLQLGYHASWDRWGGDPARLRRTDLTFLGAITERRSQILASAGPLLWDCAANIQFFESPHPSSELLENFVAGPEKWELLASSRVVLNVHQDELPHLEWIRILEAVSNGCLVITEPSAEHRPLVPGRHMVAAPADLLGAYALSVLGDEPLRAEIAASAYDFVRSRMALTTQLEPICAHLEADATKPSARRRAIPTPVSRPSAGRSTSRDSFVPSDAIQDQERVQRTNQRALSRRKEALVARQQHGDADHADTSVTTAWDGYSPNISVVVTSYNYRVHITEAIEAVMGSMRVAVELIIVDDHSQDGSASLVREFMADHDWFPMMLVARAANAGVSAARNLGVARARGSLIFFLDADNLIYPTALGKLSAALDRSPAAAFAYGMLTKSDGEDLLSDRLLSHLPWDVERLCRFNYIDTMALLRRSALEEVGGYDDSFGNLACEDYELWLRLAASGRVAELVPEFVGWYRVHSVSHSQASLPDLRQVQSMLRGRYPSLPWHQG